MLANRFPDLGSLALLGLALAFVVGLVLGAVIGLSVFLFTKDAKRAWKSVAWCVGVAVVLAGIGAAFMLA